MKAINENSQKPENAWVNARKQEILESLDKLFMYRRLGCLNYDELVTSKKFVEETVVARNKKEAILQSLTGVFKPKFEDYTLLRRAKVSYRPQFYDSCPDGFYQRANNNFLVFQHPEDFKKKMTNYLHANDEHLRHRGNLILGGCSAFFMAIVSYEQEQYPLMFLALIIAAVLINKNFYLESPEPSYTFAKNK